MTDTPSTKPSTDEILARYAVHQERVSSLVAVNKTTLFAALAEAGISRIEVRFDGYGDSGQIEEIAASAGETSVDLPSIQIPVQWIDYLSVDPVSDMRSLDDAVRDLCYALLEAGHGGWEINEGSFGDFTFDIAAGTITLAYNQRIESSEYSEHTY